MFSFLHGTVLVPKDRLSTILRRLELLLSQSFYYLTFNKCFQACLKWGNFLHQIKSGFILTISIVWDYFEKYLVHLGYYHTHKKSGNIPLPGFWKISILLVISPSSGLWKISILLVIPPPPVYGNYRYFCLSPSTKKISQ